MEVCLQGVVGRFCTQSIDTVCSIGIIADLPASSPSALSKFRAVPTWIIEPCL
jgi:hypothetical protein